jgi:hypothetical protein
LIEAHLSSTLLFSLCTAFHFIVYSDQWVGPQCASFESPSSSSDIDELAVNLRNAQKADISPALNFMHLPPNQKVLLATRDDVAQLTNSEVEAGRTTA